MTALALLALLVVAEAGGAVPTVNAVHVRGNTRTETRVILDEIRTRPGQPFNPQTWARDVQAVKDMGVFWTAGATTAVLPDRRTDLYVNIEEKWTLLPMIQYSQTSDTFQWVLGVWDPNFLGYHVESGVKVTRKRFGNGYTVWTHNPRVGGSRNYFRFKIFSDQPVYYLYDQAAFHDTPRAYFVESRSGGELEYGHGFGDDGETKAGFVYSPYTTRYALLENTPEQRAANEAARFAAPPARTAQRFGIRGEFGRLHYDDYVYHGQKLLASVLSTVPVGDTPFFQTFDAEYQVYAVPAPRHNLAVRAIVGATGSDRLEDAFFVGGLEQIRGFPDQRFYGRYQAYSNVEYRYPIVDNRYAIAQATALADTGTAWSGDFAEAGAKWGLAGGGGIRILVKPIHRMAVRFDVVRAVTPYARTEFSLGFKQYWDAERVHGR